MDSRRETRTAIPKARLMAVYEKEVIYPAAISGDESNGIGKICRVFK